MRNPFAALMLLATSIAAITGLTLLSEDGPSPVAQAQEAECPEPDNARCLLIIKETDPGGDPQDFEFEHEHDGTTTDFELEDGEQAAFLFTDQEPHTVTEMPADGWTLVEIDCDENQGVDLAINLAGGSVTVTMDVEEEPFASAVCIFVNEREPTPTPTATATGTLTPTATATLTPAAPTPTTPPSNGIQPPSTGGAGLKR